jgi:cytochrome P450
MSTTSSDELGTEQEPIEFPQLRPSLFELPVAYKELRDRCPVAHAEFPNGTRGWLLTRYDDVKALTRDRRFSARTDAPGFPQIYKGQVLPELANRSIVAMDPPDHSDQRRLISQFFTLKVAESYREAIGGFVDELIDRMLEMERPVDLVEQLALPLPIWVICHLLGIPLENRDLITERTNVRLSYTSTQDEVATATRELQAYIGELIEEKRSAPADDLTTKIVADHDAGLISHGDLVDMIQLLIIAGHETTAHSISLSIVALLSHPEQLEELRANQALLAPAVEELLRYTSISQTTVPRVAQEDVEISGQVIATGQGVRALVCSANHDPAVFDDPEGFSIHRDARQHMAFGFGIHNCIGQTYARIEMQEAIWRIFNRLPGLRLAVPVEKLDVKWEAGVHGLHSLPVTW